MPRVLEWDKAGERRFRTGVSKVVLYPDPLYENGKFVGYTNGVAWNGVTAINESPDGGEANNFFADNIKYASIRSAENAKGSISVYNYPDALKGLDGNVEAEPGLSIGQQLRTKRFGLCYRTELGTDTNPNAGYELHMVYGAMISPSEKNHETMNENPDLQEFSWDYECLPIKENVPIYQGIGTFNASNMVKMINQRNKRWIINDNSQRAELVDGDNWWSSPEFIFGDMYHLSLNSFYFGFTFNSSVFGSDYPALEDVHVELFGDRTSIILTNSRDNIVSSVKNGVYKITISPEKLKNDVVNYKYTKMSVSILFPDGTEFPSGSISVASLGATSSTTLIGFKYDAFKRLAITPDRSFSSFTINSNDIKVIELVEDHLYGSEEFNIPARLFTPKKFITSFYGAS